MRNSALQAQLCRAPHCRRCPPTGDHGAYRRLVDHRHPQHVRTPLPFPRVIADHQPGPDDCCSPPRPQLHACCTPASASTRTGSQLASLTCDNISRGGEARTPDPLLPKQVRYHCATPRYVRSTTPREPLTRKNADLVASTGTPAPDGRASPAVGGFRTFWESFLGPPQPRRGAPPGGQGRGTGSVGVASAGVLRIQPVLTLGWSPVVVNRAREVSPPRGVPVGAWPDVR